MRIVSFVAAGSIAALLACGNTGGQQESKAEGSMEKQTMQPKIELRNNEAEQQVDVTVDGKPFTSWCYWEKQYKPIIYPLRAADGRIYNRGYPIKLRKGDRIDHPHHVSAWFNYGDVNGIDFWGTSDSLDLSSGKFGRIVQRSVDGMTDGPGTGTLEVSMDWETLAGHKMLKEHDIVYFRAQDDLRIIDRIITLTALDEKIVFNDTKEGAFGIRVTRGLEEKTDQPLKYVDERGEVTTVAKMNNEGVDGHYLDSEGKVDEKGVWGTRAKWCILTGTVDGKPATIGIFGHPHNPTYPTYWHARGYGLFAANPFGWKTFTKGAKELNFTLEPGQSATFRFRIVLSTDKLDAARTEALFNQWTSEVN